MRMIALALGSFVLGALSGPLLLSGIHTSIEPQSAAAANMFLGNRKYALPVVNPIDPQFAIKGLTSGANEGGIFQLDGLNCEQCTFGDATFEYSGGAFNCVDCRFTAPEKNITLSGAALNTLRVSQCLQAQTQPRPEAPKLPQWLTEENPKIPIALNPSAQGKLTMTILSQ